MSAVFMKEFRSFFNGFLGYAFLAMYMIVVGFYFYGYNLYSAYPFFEYALSSIVPMFIIIIPVLTMRSMAEETSKKTDQLLLTSPVSVEKIIVGKFLGIYAVYAIAMVISMIYPVVLNFVADGSPIDFGRTYYALFGFFLLGGAYIAIGMFVSSVTENQVIAAVVTFVLVLATYLMSALKDIIPTGNKETWIILAVIFILIAVALYTMVKSYMVSIAFGAIGEIVLAIIYIARPSTYDNVVPSLIKWVSVVDPFNYFVNAMVDASYITYYLSIMVIFIILSVQMIKKRRWS